MLALTGVVNSAVMVGIRDTVEQARVPLIGSNASPSSLQSVFYIWRTSYVLDEAGRALGRYLRDQLPAERPDRDHRAGERRQPGRGPRLPGRSSARADPRITDPVTYTDATAQPRQDDVRLGHRARRWPSEPDAVFCFFAGAAAVEFIKQLRETFAGPIYAPGFLTEGTVLENLKEQTRWASRPR